MRLLKKSYAYILIFIFVFPLFSFTACREPLYADSLKIGTLDVPKNLMPYDSNTGSSTLIAGLIYDTLLNTVSIPADYDGEDYYFPDGTKYEPVDLLENPFLFTDNLVKAEGAYPKKEGSKYGREFYTPTEEERQKVLTRKGIREGYDELGNRIEETHEEYLERAERVVPSDNWLKYTFEVVDNITWNDGTPFTAEDIKFTFDYIIKYRGSLASMAQFLSNYSKSEVSDDGKTFTLYLATHKTSDIKTICNSILILPKHIWNDIIDPKNQKNINNPVGTGAYKLKSYSEGDSIVLSYREDFNRPGYFAYEPIETITIQKMGSIDVLINALNNGDIDTIWDSLESTKAHQIQTNNIYSNIKLASVGNEFVTTLLFNVGDKGRFGDDKFNGKGKELRQAVSLAIDQKQLIADVLYNNGQEVGPGLVPSTQPHALTDQNGNYVTHVHNIDLANQILNEAGFALGGDGYRRAPDGSPLEINILSPQSNERLAQALITQFKKIGLKFTYTKAQNDYSTIIKYSEGARFDVIINSVTFAADKLLMFDARYGFYANPPAPRLYNYAGVDDPALRQLIADMDNETDVLTQFEKAQAVQRYLADQYIEIPLFIRNNITAYTEKRFKNWIPVDGAAIFNSYTLKYLVKVEIK